MKKIKFFALAFTLFVLALGVYSCDKDTQLSEFTQKDVDIEFRSSDGDSNLSEDEMTAIRSHVAEIKTFRDQVKSWSANGANESMPSIDAIEKTEIAFNLFLGRPNTVFSHYHQIEKAIKVSDNDEWSAQEIVQFYEEVKELVVRSVNNVDNFLHIISISNAIDGDNGKVVGVFLSVGEAPVDVVEAYQFHDGTRWTFADRGFTDPTPCGGAANFDIGAAANQQIGIYQPINAGPGSGGNTPLPGNVVSRIVYGDHSYVLSNFPQGTPFPRVYDITTRGTALSALHYNSEALPPTVPPFNCLTNVQLINFTFGNLQLANNGSQFVPPAQVGPFSFPRSLLCTAVGSLAINAGIPAGDVDQPILVQDHPTRHYFGVVFNFIIFDELAPADM